MKLYNVKAKLGDQTIWLFHAIVADSKKEAISTCKWEMRKILGRVDTDYKWIAEPEWENDLGVN